ncbi:MAG TPA: hypothetical protein VD767_09145 [Thermomicrobiales bacterium]|nr:hypothetical protein [Thermomicrobiales bacterium]
MRVPSLAPDAGPISADQLKKLRAAALVTTVSGAAYAILFLISYWLMLGVPKAGSTDAELQEFYSSSDSRVVNLVALYLLPFAGIAFIWFIVSVRMWVSLRVTRPINDLFSNVQLVSGIVFLALLFASAAAISIGAVAGSGTDDARTLEVAREFPLFGGSLFFVFATRMGAMFVFTTTKICSSSGTVPKWFQWVGITVGIVMLLTSSFNRGMIVVFPLWVLTLCILTQLHVRRTYRALMAERHEATDATPEPAP